MTETVRGLVAVAVILATGCATVVNKGPAPVHVRSSPTGASATARCNGAVVASGTTPTSLGIPRQATGCSIHVSHAGYQTRTIDLTRGRSGAYWGNLGFLGPLPVGVVLNAFGADLDDNKAPFGVIGALAITGVVGFIVDRRSGRMYMHEPEEIDVTLESEQ